LSDLYFGVDVFGRGVYGDGGLNSHIAISQIDPKSLGLSVALFGQGWTWESEQDKPGWNWDAWWKFERIFWLGPETPGEAVPAPKMSELSMRKRAMDPSIPLPGPFVPVTEFFTNVPPPNPVDLPFVTCFSPGVGRKWFIRGLEVMDSVDGWTDVQKQCSLGDLVWPRPAPQWEDGGGQGELPKSFSALEMNDAWLSGSSLRLSLSFPGDQDAFFRCVWIPVQSVAITPGTSYEASLVYKTDSPFADLEIAVSIRSTTEFSISPMSSKELQNGWTELHIQFTMEKDRSAIDTPSSFGIIIGCATEDPSVSCNLSILLGSLTISPAIPSQTSPSACRYIPKILWADYRAGALTWEIAATFDIFTPEPKQPDDPTQMWELVPTSFFPQFIYFNVYVERRGSEGFYLGPEMAAEFIGTTGWDGRANRFCIERSLLPETLQLKERESDLQVRFYIQGVTDRGEVLDWSQSAFVDTKLQL
jgi:mannosyl-glycoprotein endo-beta-N-acetylglucosaminidase